MTRRPTDQMVEPVSVSVLGDGIVELTIVRPSKRNALDAATWVALTDALSELRQTYKVRCLILTGAGSTFASGGDLTSFLAEVSEDRGPERFRQRIRSCLDEIAAFPAPTIAKVNGPAIGGGLELMSACDIAIAAESATFAMPAAMFGIVMSRIELVRMASAIGVGNTRYVTMTGNTLDAETALRMGLIHEVVRDAKLRDRVAQVAQTVARADPDAILWLRESLTDMFSSASQDRTDLAQFELSCLKSSSFRRRVTSFLGAHGG